MRVIPRRAVAGFDTRVETDRISFSFSVETQNENTEIHYIHAGWSSDRWLVQTGRQVVYRQWL